jgi:hypothetical protein
VSYVPELLSLIEAITLVAERLGRDREQAMLQFRAALRDGAIPTTGYVSNVGERTQIRLAPGWWIDGEIDWDASTVRSEREGSQWWEKDAEGVQVSRSDLDRVFPTELSSGAPGRRTSIDAVLQELERRYEHNELKSSVTLEAQDLERWLQSGPILPKMKAKSIKNGITSRYREMKRSSPATDL